MANQLQMKGYRNVVKIEPNVQDFDDMAEIEDSDWVIVMTPHDEFEDFDSIRTQVDNQKCLYCDIWGTWDIARHDSDNGYFFEHEVETKKSAGQTGVSR
jgi:UDP-N-acetyl-D-mannosaminuronic acid dehydrogenase